MINYQISKIIKYGLFITLTGVLSLSGCGGTNTTSVRDTNATSNNPVKNSSNMMGGSIQPGSTLDTNSNVVTTIGGSGLPIGSADGIGLTATFLSPYAIASDGTNLYVTSNTSHTIRKIVISTGVVSTFAGKVSNPGSADGTGTNAQFKDPTGITTDGNNLYVTDTGNSTIRKINIASGVVSTLAGTVGTSGRTDDTGLAAQFKIPYGITNDGTYLYLADTGNSTIRRIEISSGIVTTIAGSALTLGSKDGAGSAANFTYPYGIALSGTNLYITDGGNHTIRKLEISTGIVTTLAGIAGTPGNANGIGTDALFKAPTGITTDGANLYVADTYNNAIRKINLSNGVVSTLAGSLTNGSTDAVGTGARFATPYGVASDGTYLYVADTGNGTIRKIVLSSGVVSTIAGVAGNPSSADGIGASALFLLPNDVTTDGSNLYVTDTGNGTIRKINIASGVVTTLAGTPGTYGSSDGIGSAAKFRGPSGITTDGINLYVTDFSNGTIRKIVISSGVVTTLAGRAGFIGSADGIGPSASFVYPAGITTDGTNLYVAEYGNNTIRKIVISSGEVTTLAGSGSYGSVNTIFTPAPENKQLPAEFKSPIGITTDGTNLYVADNAGSLIRKIVIATGVVSTLAGNAATSGSNDGAATVSKFKYPAGITTDGNNLYVTDTGNHTIRKIVIATGVVTTLAGTALVNGNVDAAGASAKFNGPVGITTDGNNLYVADTYNNTIRKIQ